MAIPDEYFNQVFQHLPDADKKSLLDYMEYLITRATKQAWNAIPEVDEPLTEMETLQIEVSKSAEYISIEQLRRELGL